MYYIVYSKLNCSTTHLAYRRPDLAPEPLIRIARFRFGDQDLLNRRKMRRKCILQWDASLSGASRNIRVGCTAFRSTLYIYRAVRCSLIIPTNLETMTWCCVQDAMFMLDEGPMNREWNVGPPPTDGIKNNLVEFTELQKALNDTEMMTLSRHKVNLCKKALILNWKSSKLIGNFKRTSSSINSKSIHECANIEDQWTWRLAEHAVIRDGWLTKHTLVKNRVQHLILGSTLVVYSL